MRTFNVKDIRAIMEHPDILPRISDGKNTDFTLNTARNIFLIDEKKANLAIIEPNGNFHFQSLPEYRHLASDFHSKAITWVKENTKFIKLTAQVPFLFKDVVGFGLKNGWDIEGVNHKSYLRDGVLHDQYYLGYQLWDS